jgi:GxxExxY protein
LIEQWKNVLYMFQSSDIVTRSLIGRKPLNHLAHKEAEAGQFDVEVLMAEIVDAGLKVHRALGPGLLESVYQHCLAYELGRRGIAARTQVALPIVYDDVRLDAGYRLDIVVEDAIIIEIKAVDELTRLHEAQILTYLKLSGYRLGFLMNFNVPLFKRGLRRMAL